MRYNEFDSAENLPPEWDRCALSNPYLSRASLRTLERTNPCSQRYVAFYDTEGNIDSLMVLYKLKLNVLTFSSLKWPLEVTIVGVPCSVSAPGYWTRQSTRLLFQEYLGAIKGLVVILNSGGGLSLPDWAQGVTLPSCILPLSYDSFEDYLYSMRSHYRYRYRKALRKGSPLEVVKLEHNECFGDDLYELYEQVHDNSAFKLEKLPRSFFQQTDAEVHVFSADGVPVGFVQLRQHAVDMHFLFGGLDYSQSSRFDTYVNMLLFIVRESIARGCRLIDFGQTAEDAKAKLGCHLQPKSMYVHHANPLLNFAIRRVIHFFDYNTPDCDFRVFKEQGGQA